jgi:WhiB family transcriptional regulator, redox-sensing transcriptional regulator
LSIRLDLPLVISSNDWEGRAACKGHDPSLFFGPNRFEPKRERLAREAAAKEVCRVCPVRQECRDHALATGETFGVWGGLGEAERRTAAASTPLRRKAG